MLSLQDCDMIGVFSESESPTITLPLYKSQRVTVSSVCPSLTQNSSADISQDPVET